MSGGAIMSVHAVNRRTFLETTGTVAAATLLTSKLGFAAEHRINKVGVQLYTVRDLMKNDFDGTIAKVAQIGYKEVEFAGYFGRTPQQVREVLDKNGLTSPACHVQYDVLTPEKWPAEIESAKVIGQKYIVNPWIPEELRKTDDDWKRATDTFNRVGAESKKAGIQFAYHNHWFEFLPVNGKLPSDMILSMCDPDLVKMEMDLCWITVAGGDPLKYFAKYPGRFPLVHVKDVKTLPKISTGGAQNFGDTVDLTEVGNGIIDWKRIFAKSDEAGIKHYIVEHDHPKQPFESIAASYAYLSKLTW
jgi:sugar phosphate isomerase/epimerase